MTKQLKNDAAILNIFKDDVNFVEEFVRYHAPMVKQLVMLNTGNKKTYDIVEKLKEEFPNIVLGYQEYSQVHFGKFRNDCLNLARKEASDCEYFIWIDTDEKLEILGEEELKADCIGLLRLDSTNRFTTHLDRIYKSDLKGQWFKVIHEHYAPEREFSRAVSENLRINHLTSEAVRPLEKRKLYYSLLVRQLAEAEKANSRQGKIDALQHLIMMASHDFKNPDLCVELFEKHKRLILSLDFSELSRVQKLNLLVHSLMSFGKLKKQPPGVLLDEILKIDRSKSTYFQAMRALVFDSANRRQVKMMYEKEYPKLAEPHPEFDNKDYLIEREIKWFEKALYGK